MAVHRGQNCYKVDYDDGNKDRCLLHAFIWKFPKDADRALDKEARVALTATEGLYKI